MSESSADDDANWWVDLGKNHSAQPLLHIRRAFCFISLFIEELHIWRLEKMLLMKFCAAALASTSFVSGFTAPHLAKGNRASMRLDVVTDPKKADLFGKYSMCFTTSGCR